MIVPSTLTQEGLRVYIEHKQCYNMFKEKSERAWYNGSYAGFEAGSSRSQSDEVNHSTTDKSCNTWFVTFSRWSVDSNDKISPSEHQALSVLVRGNTLHLLYRSVLYCSVPHCAEKPDLKWWHEDLQFTALPTELCIVL